MLLIHTQRPATNRKTSASSFERLLQEGGVIFSNNANHEGKIFIFCYLIISVADPLQLKRTVEKKLKMDENLKREFIQGYIAHITEAEDLRKCLLPTVSIPEDR